jgi:hypothetical protein
VEANSTYSWRRLCSLGELSFGPEYELMYISG